MERIKCQSVRLLCCIALSCFYAWSCHILHAQETIKLHAFVSQGLSFGAFSTGPAGGTVTITPEGNRLVTGTIIPLANSTGTAAIVEIEAPPDQLIHIEFPSSIEIEGTQRGNQIVISNFTTDKPNNTFITTADSPPYRNIVRIGATLTVKNPSGNINDSYKGGFHFIVTCVQQ